MALVYLARKQNMDTAAPRAAREDGITGRMMRQAASNRTRR
jgi:hypothetical protein